VIIYVPQKLSTGDALFGSVVLLMQRGVLVDTSSYARTLVDETGSPVSQNQTVSDFPSGNGVLINGFHNAKGINADYASELDMGNKPRCFEAFIKISTGALAGGSQILWNEGFGFNGLLWFIQFSTGKLGLRVNSVTDIIAPVSVPVIAENVSTYVCIQVHSDDSIEMWAGPVGDAFADGDVSVSSCPRPVDAIAQGPYIGYVGGSGGTNNFYVDQMRITDGDRYSGASIPIPTALFQEN